MPQWKLAVGAAISAALGAWLVYSALGAVGVDAWIWSVGAAGWFISALGLCGTMYRRRRR